jgi:glutathionyl-hydroquinone reductase
VQGGGVSQRLYANLGKPRDQLAWILAATTDRVPVEPKQDGPPMPSDGDERVTAHIVAGGATPVIRRGDDVVPGLEVVDSEETAGVQQVLDDLLAPIEALAEPADEHAYAQGFATVFDELDRYDKLLATRRFLAGGSAPTAADWALWCVLLRFDPIYYPLYKLNRTRVADMPELTGYLRDLWQLGQATDSVDFLAMKQAHFWVDALINHRRILPRGGEPDLAAPHDRAERFAADVSRAVEEQAGAPVLPGAFVRGRSAHRDWITADGSSAFLAEPGRYHIYIANNCPWCHRVALARSLRHLESVVTMDVLFYRRDPERGWQFAPDEPGCTDDRIFGHRFIKELYERLDSEETSVPLLYDRQSARIVNNESAEIIRMLDQAFGAFSSGPELYPPEHRETIDALNAWIYTDINNGAYKAGFARSQAAYDAAYARFFAAIDRLDRRLADHRFLCGDTITEADLRLFPTIYRFDHVYYTRFRLNERMVRDAVHLHRWLVDMVAIPEVSAASNLDHCRKGYFGRTGNGMVPLGPAFGFD